MNDVNYRRSWSDDLHALTLWRPWTQSILASTEHFKDCPAGPKRVENRSWPPPAKFVGQRLYLHAGEKWDDEGEAFMRKLGFVPPLSRDDEPRQAIVGYATVRDRWEVNQRQFSNCDLPIDSPWVFGPWAWVLSGVTALKMPIKCRGAQGIWRIADDVARLVRAQTKDVA